MYIYMYVRVYTLDLLSRSLHGCGSYFTSIVLYIYILDTRCSSLKMYVFSYVYIYIYIYLFIYVCVCVCLCIHI